MKIADILASAETIEESSLSKLDYWLKYEKFSFTLVSLTIWFSYALILKGLIILAIIFTPYMLWLLLKAKWYKSVVIFIILVIVPFITTQFINANTITFDFLLSYTPLLAFYIYIWVLSHIIDEYLGDIKTIKKWEIEKRLKESS